MARHGTSLRQQFAVRYETRCHSAAPNLLYYSQTFRAAKTSLEVQLELSSFVHNTCTS